MPDGSKLDYAAPSKMMSVMTCSEFMHFNLRLVHIRFDFPLRLRAWRKNLQELRHQIQFTLQERRELRSNSGPEWKSVLRRPARLRGLRSAAAWSWPGLRSILVRHSGGLFRGGRHCFFRLAESCYSAIVAMNCFLSESLRGDITVATQNWNWFVSRSLARPIGRASMSASHIGFQLCTASFACVDILNWNTIFLHSIKISPMTFNIAAHLKRL